MDWLRSCYTTHARFYRTAPIEADIVWYFCEPNAPTLEHPTAFGSRNFLRVKEATGNVGELPRFDPPYRKGNKPDFASPVKIGTPAEFAAGLDGIVPEFGNCEPLGFRIVAGVVVVREDLDPAPAALVGIAAGVVVVREDLDALGVGVAIAAGDDVAAEPAEPEDEYIITLPDPPDDDPEFPTEIPVLREGDLTWESATLDHDGNGVFVRLGFQPGRRQMVVWIIDDTTGDVIKQWTITYVDFDFEGESTLTESVADEVWPDTVTVDVESEVEIPTVSVPAPVNTAAQYWTVDLAGAPTNASCSVCNKAGVSAVLAYSSGLLWFSPNRGSACGTGSQDRWRMDASSSTVFVTWLGGAFSSAAVTYTFTRASFDFLTPITANYSADGGQCGSWPSSIVLTPAPGP